MIKGDNQSIIAKQLMDEAKLDEAIQIINKIEKVERKNPQYKILFQLLQCDLLYQQGLFEDVDILAENTYKDSLRLDLIYRRFCY